MERKEWFASWFDTNYYHILYQSRDDVEATEFIERLVHFMRLKPNTPVLDLACGKGRHAKTLADLGLNVTGLDLSENSIHEARKHSCTNLTFGVHDMREVYNDTFEVVFNLFTSFGYFDDQKDNEKVIKAVYEMLTDSGFFVIDFMNATRVIEQLVNKETKTAGGIEFRLSRSVINEHIVKQIDFDDKGEHFHFEERVQALRLNDFRNLLEKNGFEIVHLFGNYTLDSFEEKNSERLIIIAKKIT
jgi:cyclopropane fatty-acyl-phospholipid synthase-like methyltransferase